MIGQTVGHYKIVEKLGEGGMGEVYRAEDTRLKRQVALKVLPPGLASSQERLERFQREAETLAALDHPNIVMIYSVEEAAPDLQRGGHDPEVEHDPRGKGHDPEFLRNSGHVPAQDRVPYSSGHVPQTSSSTIHFLTMQLVDGKRLSQVIPKRGMSLEKIFEVAIPLADALSAAHEKGVIHRDLKPANIMVTVEGRVKVLDFGLAKLRQEAVPEEATALSTEPLTEEGKILGTVPYMSPEQLEGKRLDLRSDIFSLGVILYEMATGERPFRGDSSVSLILSICREKVPEVDTVRQGLPHHLGRIISHCLEKDPEDRFQSIKDVRNELKSLKKETESGAISASRGIVVPPTPVQPEIPSIAVLPFANMSADPDQEYFCDGLAEELIDALARIKGLRVVARTSAFQFKNQAHDLRSVGEQLNVGSVLQGSVRKSGSRLRINAQLINTEDGYHTWSERYDREMDDIFAVQDDIARAVVEQLKIKLFQAEGMPLVEAPTENLGAYNLFLKGRYLWQKQTKESLASSIECFDQALTEAPEYAQAHAGRALALAMQAILNFTAPNQVMGLAKEAAQRAVAADDTVAEGHLALGWVAHVNGWDWREAETEFRRAIELNRADGVARSCYANLLVTWPGRMDEALSVAKRAVELDPLSAWNAFMLVLALNYCRRFDDTIEQARRMLKLHPGHPVLYWNLGVALAGVGRTDEAIATFRDGLAVTPGDPHLKAYLAWALAVAGQRERALSIVEELKQQRENEYFGGFLMAIAFIGLGDHDAALAWLAKASEERDCIMVYLNAWWVLDPLRPDARFQALVRRIGFPEPLVSESHQVAPEDDATD